MKGLVALMSDLGSSDYFVASIKGVISTIAPGTTIVDITHGIPPYNVARAAFILWMAYKWFPFGTVFMVIVDPGVGSGRRSIAIRGNRYYFVGPDNGVLSPAAKDDGIVDIVELSRGLSTGISRTFHGRDLFAPAAAALASGIPMRSIGSGLNDMKVLELLEHEMEGETLKVRIVYVDRFGNVYTSYRGKPPWSTGEKLRVDVGGHRITAKISDTYGLVEKGEPLLLVNSEGFLELAVSEGSFSDVYGVSEGDEVTISKL